MKKETPKICEVIGVKVNQILSFQTLYLMTQKSILLTKMEKLKV